MILITGATGLVGSHLALHLIENGESVRAIYRNKASIDKTKSLFNPNFSKTFWADDGDSKMVIQGFRDSVIR